MEMHRKTDEMPSGFVAGVWTKGSGFDVLMAIF
jgi:hypothetical protein